MLMQHWRTERHNYSRGIKKIWLLTRRNLLPLLPIVFQRNSGQRNLLTQHKAGKQGSCNQFHLILHLLLYALPTLTTLLPLPISLLTWVMTLRTLNTRTLIMDLMYDFTCMLLLMSSLFYNFLVIYHCPLSLSSLLAQ